MQTGYPNRPLLATQNLPTIYKPTYNGVIATQADLWRLLNDIDNKRAPLTLSNWNHPPPSYLAGQTFIWDVTHFSEDQAIPDGAFWSRGVFHCHTGPNNTIITQVLQIEATWTEHYATWAEHHGTYGNADDGHDRISVADVPADGEIHFSQFAHHLDRHGLTKSRLYNRERLIRQQLLVWHNSKHYLATSYYTMREVQTLNRPTHFKQSCIGKIENYEDVEKLVELVEAGRFPQALFNWTVAKSLELAHLNGTVLVWNVEPGFRSYLALKDCTFEVTLTLPLREGASDQDLSSICMIQHSEHPIANPDVWKTAQSSAAKMLYRSSQYTLETGERLIKQRIRWRRAKGEWLIMAFYYDSQWHTLERISKIYDSYKALDGTAVQYHHQRQQPVASSSSRPHGN